METSPEEVRALYRRLRCLLLLLCLALPGAAAGAEGAVEEQLARMFEKYSTLGASVAVFQNGSVTYTYTYGQIRPGGPEVTADTVFQVGSISKDGGLHRSFTADGCKGRVAGRRAGRRAGL